MNCPKCETSQLQAVRIRDVEVDRCARCQGIWFDERELAQILQFDARELRPLAGSEDDHRNRQLGQCPRDATPLLRAYSAVNAAVVVDTCTECRGVWLDGGELARLQKPGTTS